MIAIMYPLVGVRKNYYSGPRVLHSKNTLHYKVSGKMSSIRHVRIENNLRISELLRLAKSELYFKSYELLKYGYL